MFHESTNGLNVVTDAMASGSCNIDEKRYNQVRQNIRKLGSTGPWDKKTASDMLKKTVTGIPVLGKIIGFLWPSTDGVRDWPKKD